MTTHTTTLHRSGGSDAFVLNKGYFARRNLLDWLFAALVLAGGRFKLDPARSAPAVAVAQSRWPGST